MYNFSKNPKLEFNDKSSFYNQYNKAYKAQESGNTINSNVYIHP